MALYGRELTPSVVLQLNHIKFDLVPALKQQYSGYRIPNGANAWQVPFLFLQRYYIRVVATQADR